MADSTLARMFWSRVDGSEALPAHVVKRGGRWLTLTWAEAGEAVASAARALLALGRQKGEAVALLSGSGAEWVWADFAILSAGCITVPIYSAYTPEQIADLVNEQRLGRCRATAGKEDGP